MKSKIYLSCIFLFTLNLLVSMSCSKKEEKIEINCMDSSNLHDIGKYISISLPVLLSINGFEHLDMKAVSSENGGAILIGGKVPTKNTMAILYLYLKTETELYFNEPIDIEWNVFDYKGELYRVDEMSEDWLDDNSSA